VTKPVLVLDLDGVVITGHPEGGRWDKHIERDLGLKPALLQERFFKAHWKHIEIGNADLFAVLDEVWPSLECAGCTPRAFVDYWLSNDSNMDTGVIAQVDAWRANGGKAFLATVQEHHRAKHIWEALGLSNHFDGIIYSADIGAKKPHADFYERALAKLPVSSPAELIFLDDRLDNVEAARSAGWRASHYRDVEDLKRALTGTPSQSPS